MEPPLWCAMLAVFISRNGFKVEIIDAEAENLTPEETVRRVGSTSLVAVVVQGANPSASSTPKMVVTMELTKLLKEKHLVLLIGIHPSARPEETFYETGVPVCVGEGFYTTLAMLNGAPFELVPGLYPNRMAHLMPHDKLPSVAYDLLPMNLYRSHNWQCLMNQNMREPYGTIYTSLGCPFNCSFCNIKALYNNRTEIRFRPVDHVLNDIDILYNTYQIRTIKIIDELFAINPPRVIEICNKIAERRYGLNMWAYARVDTVSPEMLHSMKRAGIDWVCYGFESASTGVRKEINKTYDMEFFDRAIQMTREAGINIIANFIFGLPGDTVESMRHTLEIAKAYLFEYVNFYVHMAYPGSKLYREHKDEVSEDWATYSQFGPKTMPFTTGDLTPASVLEFRDTAFNEYFTNPFYLEMIEKKFNRMAVAHIQEMLGWQPRTP